MREWRERVDAELDNLRAAMEWSLAGSVEKGLRLVSALHWYWHGRMHLFSESAAWLERLLAAEEGGSEELRRMPARRVARGKALNVCAHRGLKSPLVLGREAVEIFTAMGETYHLDRTIALVYSGQMDLVEVLQIFREIGDRFYLTHILWELAEGAVQEGNLPQARQYLEESLALIREIGYCEGEGSVLLLLGKLAFWLGDPTRAVEMINSAAKCFTAAGSIGKNHFHIRQLALIALAQGDYQQAEHRLKFCLAIDHEFSIQGHLTIDLMFLSWVAWASGRMDLVNQYLDEAMQLAQKVGLEIYCLAYYVLARKAILEGDYAQAYKYLRITKTNDLPGAPVSNPGLWRPGSSAGADETRRGFVRISRCVSLVKNMISPPERDAYQQALAAVRAALSAEELAAAWAQGQAMKAQPGAGFRPGECSGRLSNHYPPSTDPTSHIPVNFTQFLLNPTN